jgi:hypothetical protein
MTRRALDRRQPATQVVAAFGVSDRMVRKWLVRRRPPE